MANGQVFTNQGRAVATNLVSGLGGTVPKFVGWGTGTTTPVAADTGLQTASSEARTNGTASRITTSVTNDTMQVVGTVTSTQTQAITEVALYDASSAGNSFIHAVFSAVNVVNNDSIAFTITWQLT